MSDLINRTFQGVKMQLSKIPLAQRPREKLLQQGAANLTDAELLAIFLRTGIAGCNAIELAQKLLLHHESLQSMFNASCDDFCQVKGVGEAKYVQLQAVLELAKRYLLEPLERNTVFDSPNGVQDYLQMNLRGQQKELFVVLLLDSQNRLIHNEVLFSGTINAAAVYPREVVKLVLAHNAAHTIFAHNHPSGIAEPSEADKLITNKLQKALNLIDVTVLDHIVIGADECVSFAQRGLL